MVRVFVSLEAPETASAIAQALRDGLPDAHLIGLSRAPEDIADSVMPLDEIRTTDGPPPLSEGDFWIPSGPNAVQRGVSEAQEHNGLLIPPEKALSRTSGPAVDGAASLPVATPDWISGSAPVEDIHAFGRTHNWDLWMRNAVGNRRPLSHWSDFEAVRAELLTNAHDDQEVYVQARVEGTPLTVSFAADRGRLIDAVRVRPAHALGTYDVGPLSPSLEETLAHVLDELNWTGGGSIDLIEESDGPIWLDTWHPCFGPEVEGVSRCGPNLPARLIAARSDVSVRNEHTASSGYVEVTRRMPAETTENEEVSPSTVGPLNEDHSANDAAQIPGSDAPMTHELQEIVADLPEDGSTGETPRHVLLPNRMERRFEAFVEAAARVESEFDLETARVGLSIKTNPSDSLLRAARTSGMLAETIHHEEMAHARRHGYSTDEMIVNGPVQALLPRLSQSPYALFGDAITDLQALPFDPADTIIGVRTRPPERGPSRFGVDLSDAARMDRLCNTLAALPESTRIGLHLHAPSSTLGHDRWWASVDRVLDWAQTIENRIDRPVECLDLGGGWHPDDWLDVFVPGLLERKDQIRQSLPNLEVILLEPGKALSQPLGVVVSRVLDARPSRSEVILDASIAELSNIDYHPHRLLAHTADHGWHRLPRGNGRLLGRLCMEADILGRRRRVSHLSPGDPVVVCDAGAYDASMTYPFGRGSTTSDS